MAMPNDRRGVDWRRRTPRTTKALRVAVGLTAAGAVGVGAPLGAGADTFGNGPPDEGYRHDGGDQTFCYNDSATSRIRQAARDAMNNLESQTNLGIAGPLTCSSATDARFGLTSTAVDGNYVCLAMSGNICTNAAVRINPNRMADDNDWKQTACHEVGHSTGLRHGGTIDCMTSGTATGDTLQYSGHHVSHINNQN